MTTRQIDPFHGSVCPSCGTDWYDHPGVERTCAKWQSDKFLLRGALRIIRDAGLQVGSTELLEAAKKEDGLLADIENSVGIRRCRYCEGHPVMDLMKPGVYECPECCYEEAEQ